MSAFTRVYRFVRVYIHDDNDEMYLHHTERIRVVVTGPRFVFFKTVVVAALGTGGPSAGDLQRVGAAAVQSREEGL